MLLDGLRYVDSWVTAEFDRCFQLMECDDEQLFQQWIAHWHDLVDFEIVAVHTSKPAVMGLVFRGLKKLREQFGDKQSGAGDGP